MKIEKEKASVGLNLKGLEHKVSKSQKDSREAAQRVRRLPCTLLISASCCLGIMNIV